MKRRYALLLGAPVALFGLACAAFVGLYVVRPRFILADVDAFVARHGAGSALADLVADSLLERATTIHVADAGPRVGVFAKDRSSLEAALRTRRKGVLDLMWTHTPPFGRVSAIVTFEDGRVVDLQQTFLD